MLAVISCYFNPVGYATHKKKYEQFRKALPKCNYFCAEASFDGRFVTDAKLKIKATPANLMWQKERMLNLIIEQLPAKFTSVCWIDCDLVCLNPDWLRDCEVMLERYPCGQPWSRVYYVDPQGKLTHSHPSMCWRLHNHSTKEYAMPGGIWAARRDVLRYGLIDHNIIGGGDSMQVAAWSGADYKNFTGSLINDAWYQAFEIEKVRHFELVRGSCGYAPTDCYHIYHGSSAGRQYAARFSVLRENDFDPRAHLVVDGNGLWRWTDDAPEAIRTGVANYFASRREDDWPVSAPLTANPQPHAAKAG